MAGFTYSQPWHEKEELTEEARKRYEDVAFHKLMLSVIKLRNEKKISGKFLVEIKINTELDIELATYVTRGIIQIINIPEENFKKDQLSST